VNTRALAHRSVFAFIVRSLMWGQRVSPGVNFPG
jgi:hypothetical protein